MGESAVGNGCITTPLATSSTVSFVKRFFNQVNLFVGSILANAHTSRILISYTDLAGHLNMIKGNIMKSSGDEHRNALFRHF